MYEASFRDSEVRWCVLHACPGTSCRAVRVDASLQIKFQSLAAWPRVGVCTLPQTKVAAASGTVQAGRQPRDR